MQIYYKISLDTFRHIYTIELSFIAQETAHHLKLPTWIPGSYMLREFSKNIIYLNIIQASNPKATSSQVNKNTWHLEGLIPTKQIVVKYEVYAYDLGVRSAFLDINRGFFNSSSLCLYIDNYQHVVHYIHLHSIPLNWQVVTALEQDDIYYRADNYDHLIDCPFELGTINILKFDSQGASYTVALSGNLFPNIDYELFIEDISKICYYQVAIFGGIAPFKHYTFMLYLGVDVFTGLEHRNSTALMAPAYAMPGQFSNKRTKEYISLLGLISHEYLHSWNVKRIKPAAFTPYNLEQENYTGLLWWFEGITSYYDNLVLYRCNLISQDEYLGIIIDKINNVYQYDGVKQQTLINSSLTSWVKYYRSDENSPNSLVNYYLKGALVGLCLDLLIRIKSHNSSSLDQVLVGLFEKYQQDGLGIEEDELSKLISYYAKVDVTKEVCEYTSTTNTLPLTQLFASFGLELNLATVYTPLCSGQYLTISKPDTTMPSVTLACKVSKISVGYKVIKVYNSSLASEIGLAKDDILIALNHVELTNIDKQFAYLASKDRFSLSVLRNGNLLELGGIATIKEFSAFNLVVTDATKLKEWL